MNEEAGFIAALLADPADRTVLLVYADWLDDRDDPRGEFLRLLMAEVRDERRLTHLRKMLDPGWVHLIMHRHFRVWDRVRLTQGYQCEGILIEIFPDRWSGRVRLHAESDEGYDLEVALGALERLDA
jgi:uncharacterized protein (TIGR02996 family)